MQDIALRDSTAQRPSALVILPPLYARTIASIAVLQGVPLKLHSVGVDLFQGSHYDE